MCGIVGVISEREDKKDSVPEKIYCGLFFLQHRGHDSAGMYVIRDDKEIVFKKSLGLVTEVFKKEDLLRLNGKIGIGHVRYTTAGENRIEDAQPFTVKRPVNMAIASNGNVVNVKELSDYLWHDNNIDIDSGCDTEILLRIFALELKKILN